MAWIGHSGIGYFDEEEITEGSMVITWALSALMSANSGTKIAYVYGRKNASGSARFKVSVYEKGATLEESVLVGYAVGTMDSQTPQWWDVPLELPLDAGKEYVAALQFEGAAGYVYGWYNSAGADYSRIVADTGFIPPPTLAGGENHAREWSFYVTYEGGHPHISSTPLLACIGPPVRWTSGRTTTYEAGHPPGNVLDGNPNTYWKPDTLTDKVLWFDLGRETAVDAVMFWLHNYNETYGRPKTWILGHSNDNITYTPVDEKAFEDVRDDGSPMVVDVLQSQVSARYWIIQFSGFNDHPPGPKIEVSTVRFMNSYDMRHRGQLPSSDLSSFGSVAHGSMSGNEYAEETHVGRGNLLTTEFLVTSASEYEKLRDAHRASRGGCRPIVVKPDIEDTWKMCTFNGGLSETQTEFGLYRPTVRLKEVGFRRVPFTRKPLPPLDTTVAWWRFNEGLLDESGNGNHLVAYPGHPLVQPAYIPGLCEPGKTALNFPDGTEDYGVYIPYADADDLDMGMSSFTIEAVFLQENSNLSTVLSKKIAAAGWRLFARIFSSSGGIRFEIEDDASNAATIDTGDGDGTGKWKYYVIVVNRTADTVNIYVDGVRTITNYDISNVTGNITNATENFYVHTVKDDLAIDEVCISKGYMGGDLIAERAAGFVHYGTWGM